MNPKHLAFLSKFETLARYVSLKCPQNKIIQKINPFGETLALLLRTTLFNGANTNPITSDKLVWDFTTKCAEVANNRLLTDQITQVAALKPKTLLGGKGPDLRTALEKTDTLIRLFMHYGLVHELIRVIDNQELLEQFYAKTSFLIDQTNRKKLINTLQEFKDVQFEVAYESDLDKKPAPVDSFIVSAAEEEQIMKDREAQKALLEEDKVLNQLKEEQVVVEEKESNFHQDLNEIVIEQVDTQIIVEQVIQQQDVQVEKPVESSTVESVPVTAENLNPDTAKDGELSKMHSHDKIIIASVNQEQSDSHDEHEIVASIVPQTPIVYLENQLYVESAPRTHESSDQNINEPKVVEQKQTEPRTSEDQTGVIVKFSGSQNVEVTLFCQRVEPGVTNVVSQAQQYLQMAEAAEIATKPHKNSTAVLQVFDRKQVVFDAGFFRDPDLPAQHTELMFTPTDYVFDYYNQLVTRPNQLLYGSEELIVTKLPPPKNLTEQLQTQRGACRCGELIFVSGSHWLDEYSSELCCTRCARVRTNAPWTILQLDFETEVQMQRSSAKTVASYQHVPTILNERLPLPTLNNHEFHRVVQLRKQLQISYSLLRGCWEVNMEYSRFVKEVFAQFELTDKQGSIDLRPSIVLQGFEHFACPESAVLFKNPKTEMFVCASPGYWCLQDFYEYESGKLLNAVLNGLIAIEQHVFQCKTCKVKFWQRCRCGKDASLCGIDVVVCDYCGAIAHERCRKQAGQCYVCCRNM